MTYLEPHTDACIKCVKPHVTASLRAACSDGAPRIATTASACVPDALERHEQADDKDAQLGKRTDLVNTDEWHHTRDTAHVTAN